MSGNTYKPKLDVSDWQLTKESEYEQILSIISPELHTFVAEHAQLGKKMDQVRAGYSEKAYADALKSIGEELDQHFCYEEEFILPRLGHHILSREAGPIKKLIQEHQVIRNRYAEALELYPQRDEESVRDLFIQKMNLLAYLLKKHIEKEDHYFFPMVSLILNEQEKAEIAALVKRETAASQRV
ncbi:hemerythrin domain-containing protein [Brevibacillus massiliensis]|jgi:hemerythrin-like domain-containing protein|uniref:hemerythrin domain-containing protein n=1 Tax=Brevibacillus massiliensis TaxID=1118054 RepID=UPI000313104C|nr:hemerythrin domain-containing protein [Brevibacillus massiliensis]